MGQVYGFVYGGPGRDDPHVDLALPSEPYPGDETLAEVNHASVDAREMGVGVEHDCSIGEDLVNIFQASVYNHVMPKESPTTTTKAFFEDVPPGVFSEVVDICGETLYAPGTGSTYVKFNAPELLLHCTNETCEGPRLFDSNADINMTKDMLYDRFVIYTCKNCTKTTKTYAVLLCAGTNRTGTCFKYGEFPGFGPPTPARLITLVGPDRELFLKGRRAENQGLGIAAFAYYRRVVESQKNRIFDEVIRVCNRLSADPEMVAELNAAKAEIQFSKAVGHLKLGIPQALFINGQNPLTLLHGALSEGLHDESDEECLELATVVRTVLAAFAERMAQALKNEAELDAAVNRLVKKRAVPKAALPSGEPTPDTES